MNEITILDAAERYLRGEMSLEEKATFDQLRQSNPEVDQLVVEHSFFLHELEQYGTRRDVKHTLLEVHNQLLQDGAIKEENLTTGAKVVNIWKRYKRTITIAASIAGITALTVSGMMLLVAPRSNNSDVVELGKKFQQIEQKQKQQDRQINTIKSKISPDASIKAGGSAFLINIKGYLITNAHVVRNAKEIFATNNKGQDFKVIVVKKDEALDIAILKIEDADFKNFTSIPYGIRKSSTDIAEPIFTLGFPRNEIVYGEGYLSAKTGFNGDTLSCQIAIAANPGNSGGPVFNRNGEIIGMLSTKESQAEGVVFAVQSKYIIQAINQLKKDDTTLNELKLPVSTSLKGLDKIQQVKKIQDYVFMIKVY